jgi:hypothetical protein
MGLFERICREHGFEPKLLREQLRQSGWSKEFFCEQYRRISVNDLLSSFGIRPSVAIKPTKPTTEKPKPATFEETKESLAPKPIMPTVRCLKQFKVVQKGYVYGRCGNADIYRVELAVRNFNECGVPSKSILPFKKKELKIVLVEGTNKIKCITVIAEFILSAFSSFEAGVNIVQVIHETNELGVEAQF